jgi:hypothetical protein
MIAPTARLLIHEHDIEGLKSSRWRDLERRGPSRSSRARTPAERSSCTSTHCELATLAVYFAKEGGHEHTSYTAGNRVSSSPQLSITLRHSTFRSRCCMQGSSEVRRTTRGPSGSPRTRRATAPCRSRRELGLAPLPVARMRAEVATLCISNVPLRPIRQQRAPLARKVF